MRQNKQEVIYDKEKRKNPFTRCAGSLFGSEHALRLQRGLLLKG